MTKTRVYLRADGNSQIGLGHVHRLLALAEILNKEFDCIFVTRQPLPGIKQLIENACNGSVEISEQTQDDEITQILKELTGKEIIVLDGYKFDTKYQTSMASKGSVVVCVDDINAHPFKADVVINPAGGIDTSNYSLSETTSLLTGPRYAFVKKPFRDFFGTLRDHANSNLFICMGGADVNNLTLTTLKTCIHAPFQSLHIVIGEAYRHEHSLREFISSASKDVKLWKSVESGQLAEIMRDCGVAVCSSSGIAYEYLTIGGELYIIQTADNQSALYQYLISESFAFPFAEFRTPQQRVAYSRKKQLETFDGNSDKRLLKIFYKLDFKVHATQRRAVKGDLEALFNWANDPEARSQSFRSDQISLTDHASWFDHKLSDPNCIIFVFEYKGNAVGVVRFDVREETAISYSIDRSFRGRGWGQLMLESAIKSLKAQIHLPVKIIGFVKDTNESSKSIFRKLGFKELSTNLYPQALKYELTS
jgi:UDP-2,4-diacetamido-2,4,6-trideoxy-beta-L-altropyranose hydrolase